MSARIFSTLLLWTITVLMIVYAGSLGWALIMAALSAASLWEVSEILKKMGLRPLKITGQVANLAIFASAWGLSYFGICARASGAIGFAICAVILAISILKHPYDDYAQKSALPTTIMLTAIPFMLQWLVVMGVEARTQESSYTGIVLAVWILAAAKFSDVGAYVIGAAFGRKKMAESISPKKTVEGAIGGIISSAAVSICIFWGFAEILPSEFTATTIMLSGAIIGTVAILSDLLESVLKRRANVKDSGALIPGIGGALDLADSLLLTSPLGFLIVSIII